MGYYVSFWEYQNQKFLIIFVARSLALLRYPIDFFEFF